MPTKAEMIECINAVLSETEIAFESFPYEPHKSDPLYENWTYWFLRAENLKSIRKIVEQWEGE